MIDESILGITLDMSQRWPAFEDQEEFRSFGPHRYDCSARFLLLYGYLCRLELSFYFGNLEFAENMAIKTMKVDSDKSSTTTEVLA